MFNYIKPTHGLPPKLTPANILSRVRSEEVFEWLLHHKVHIGSKYTNPLRSDKRAGCYYEYRGGRLCFYDWGYYDKGQDCFAMAMRVFNCDFREALIRINNHFQLGLDGFTGSASASAEPKYDLQPMHKAVVSKTKIRVVSGEMTLEVYKYFAIRGISPSVLNKSSLNLVRRVFILRPNSLQWVEIKIDRPTYYWQWEDRYKLYSPDYGMIYMGKRHKWLSTAKKDDLYGYRELSKNGEHLIITSSGVDMDCHKSHFNHPIVATQGEHSMPSDNIILELKQRFNNIYVMYDRDKAGIEAAEKASKLYGFNKIEFPTTRNGCKDPSEIHSLYGSTAYKEIFRTII